MLPLLQQLQQQLLPLLQQLQQLQPQLQLLLHPQQHPLLLLLLPHPQQQIRMMIRMIQMQPLSLFHIVCVTSLISLKHTMLVRDKRQLDHQKISASGGPPPGTQATKGRMPP